MSKVTDHAFVNWIWATQFQFFTQEQATPRQHCTLVQAKICAKKRESIMITGIKEISLKYPKRDVPGAFRKMLVTSSGSL